MKEYYLSYEGRVTELDAFVHNKPRNWAFCISPVPSENKIIVRRNTMKFNRIRAAKLVSSLRNHPPKIEGIDCLIMDVYVISGLETISLLPDSSEEIDFNL